MIELDKANVILEKIAAKFEKITPVSVEDIDIFNKAISQNKSHTYGNSWTYLTQGVYGTGPNNLGYKFFDKDAFSVLTIYPKIDNPKKLMLFWIHPMGKSAISKIVKISEEIKIEFNLDSYVKKINKQQFEEIKRLGFKDTSELPWHPIAPKEDDTFPEVIFNISNSLKELQNASRRRNIKKSYKKALELKSIHKIEFSTKDFEKTAWMLTDTFFERDYPSKKLYLSNKFDYRNPIFTNPNKNNRKIIYVDSKPEGFFILEKQNSKFSSLYVLITLRDIPYLADLAYFYIFDNCETPYLNTGGSEDRGIHNFKMKFKPALLQKMYWATNYDAI